MSDIDDVLDHQNWADKVMASVSKGVTERPPVAGVKYKAFGVLPPEPGNLLGFAIGHRTGEKLVVDVVRRAPSSLSEKKIIVMPISITTGPTFTPEQYAQALATLEARAVLAERNGLPRVAKSWRDRIASMKPPEAGVVDLASASDKTRAPSYSHHKSPS